MVQTENKRAYKKTKIAAGIILVLLQQREWRENLLVTNQIKSNFIRIIDGEKRILQILKRTAG